MTQTFDEEVVVNDKVEINGSDPGAVQLRVKGASGQAQSLQTWQENGGDVLVQVTDDGRLQIGDQGVSTPDALIEASKEVAVSDLERGLNTHGQIDIDAPLSEATSWSVHEVELTGQEAETVSGAHSALRARLIYDNDGDASAAKLRAGDLEAINQSEVSEPPVGQITGLRAPVSNGAGAYLNKAVGVEASISNETGGDVAEVAAFEVAVPINGGTIDTLYGLRVPSFSGVQGTVTNYAAAQLGDDVEMHVLDAEPSRNPPANFVKVYPKLSDGVPKLYAKDSAGAEHSLSSSGSGHTIQVEGSNMAARTHLNIIAGPNVDIEGVDNSGDDSTDVTISVEAAAAGKKIITETILYELTTSTAAASFDVPSIPATYTHLKIEIVARTDRGSSARWDDLKINFNGDTTVANYRSTNAGHGTALFGSVQDTPYIGAVPANTYDNTADRGIMQIWIPFYANTNVRKILYTQAFGRSYNGEAYISHNGVQWESNVAINRITISSVNGANFVANSMIRVIGIKEEVVGTPIPPDYVLIQEQQAQNASAGTLTSGSWQTRVLNTEVTDTGNLATLASNQITLKAGTYRCRIVCPGMRVDRHQARLQNITAGTTLLTGTSEYSDNTDDYAETKSVIVGRFTLTVDSVLEVQHRCQTTHSYGLGLAANFTTEVYTSAEFWREPESSLANALPDLIEMFADAAMAVSGTWDSMYPSTSQPYGHHIYNSSGGNGNEHSYSFVARAGTYTIKFLGDTNTDRAKTDIYVDGVVQGTFDWYSSGLTWNVYKTLTGVSVLTSGRHTLNVKINGKGSGSGYYVAYTKVILIRTGD